MTPGSFFAPARALVRTAVCTLAAFGALAGTAHAAGKTLVFCSDGSPAGFDSAQYTTSTDLDAGAHAVYDTLVEFQRGSLDLVPGLGRIQPVVATSRNLEVLNGATAELKLATNLEANDAIAGQGRCQSV